MVPLLVILYPITIKNPPTMKSLKRISAMFALGFALMMTSNASAQEESIIGDTQNYEQGFRLGFGVNAGYVFEDAYDYSLGIDARLQYDLSKRTSVTLTTGFTNLFVGEDGFKDIGFIPVKAGFQKRSFGKTNFMY